MTDCYVKIDKKVQMPGEHNMVLKEWDFFMDFGDIVLNQE